MNDLPRAVVLVRAAVLALGACVGEPAQAPPPSEPIEAAPAERPMEPEPVPPPAPVLVEPAPTIPELDEKPPVRRRDPVAAPPPDRPPAPTCGPCCHGHCPDDLDELQ